MSAYKEANRLAVEQLGTLKKVVDRMKEKDPLGLDQHASGAKLDGGKVRVSLVLKAFSRALYAVCGVGTFGAAKYTDDGWLNVEDAARRYDDAKCRHQLKWWMGETNDQETEFLHISHEAWNALARLEKWLRDNFEDAQEVIEYVEESTRDAIAKLDKD